MEAIDPFTIMKWNKDQRLKEVRKLLSSTELMIIDVKDNTLADAMLVQAQQQHLLVRSQCWLALPVGRGVLEVFSVFFFLKLLFVHKCTLLTFPKGMFTMGMQKGKQPVMTETVEIPPINLSGRVKGTSATLCM